MIGADKKCNIQSNYVFYIEINFQSLTSDQISQDADFKKIQLAMKTHQ